MDKKTGNKAALESAVKQLEMSSTKVKELSKEVENGLAPKSALNNEIERLKKLGGKVKFLQAEARVLAGWEPITFNDVTPPKPVFKNLVYILIALLALGYLVK